MTGFFIPGARARLTALAAVAAAAVLAAPSQVAAQQQAPVANQVATASPARRVATRDTTNEQAMKQTVAGVATMDALMKSKVLPLNNVRASRESSFLTNSVLLSDGETYTAVPVGSILNLPPSHRRRVVQQPVGEFVFWPEFLMRNAAWLTTKEVPLKMAKGDAESAKAVLRETAKDPRVIVSVYKGGPITILEASPEADAARKAAAKAQSEGAAAKDPNS